MSVAIITQAIRFSLGMRSQLTTFRSSGGVGMGTGGLGDWETGRLGDWGTGRLGDWETGGLGGKKHFESFFGAPVLPTPNYS